MMRSCRDNYHSVFSNKKMVAGLLILLFLPLFCCRGEESRFDKKDTIAINLQLRKATYFMQTDNDSVLYFTLKVLKQSQVVGYQKGIVDASNILGFIYTQKQNWITPLEREKLARLFAANLNENKQLSDILLGTAQDYYEYNEKNRAAQTLLLAFKVAEYENNTLGAANALIRRAEILYELNKTEEGQKAFESALPLVQTLGDSLMMSTFYFSKGRVNYLHQDYRQSLVDYKLSKSYLEGRHTLKLFYCYLGIAQDYIELGNRDEALRNIHQAEQMSGWRDNLEAKIQYILVQAQVNELVDHPQSIVDYKLYVKLKDSLNTINHISYVNRLRDVFNSQKNEKQLESIYQEVEIERIKRRTFIIVGLILCIMVVVIVVSVRKRNRILRRENDIANEQIRLVNERNQIEHEKAENRKQVELIEKEQLRQNLERAEIERRELALELDEKHRTLLTNSMQNEQYNDFLNDILSDLKKISVVGDKTQGNKLLSQLTNRVQSHLNQADDWDKTKLYFEKVHPQFFEKLKSDYPDLSVNELKMCAYTKMNLNGKEISRLLNINPNSVQVARYRLKRKMNLPEAVNFTDFISQNY